MRWSLLLIESIELIEQEIAKKYVHTFLVAALYNIRLRVFGGR